jgi:hypothetical protein
MIKYAACVCWALQIGELDEVEEREGADEAVSRGLHQEAAVQVLHHQLPVLRPTDGLIPASYQTTSGLLCG